MTGCGLKEDVVLEHTRILSMLEESNKTLKVDIEQIKALLQELQKTLCISNGKQSVVDGVAENKARIQGIKKDIEDGKLYNKWAIDKLVIIAGIVANLVYTWYRK